MSFIVLPGTPTDQVIDYIARIIDGDAMTLVGRVHDEALLRFPKKTDDELHRWICDNHPDIAHRCDVALKTASRLVAHGVVPGSAL